MIAALIASAWIGWPIAERGSAVYAHFFKEGDLDPEYREVAARFGIDEADGHFRVHVIKDWLSVYAGNPDNTDDSWFRNVVDSQPGNGRAWVPSADSIEDAYGALMATLLSDLLPASTDRETARALDREQRAWRDDLVRNRSSKQGQTAQSIPHSASIASYVQRLTHQLSGEPVLRDLGSDFDSYENRSENGSDIYGSAPRLSDWAREPSEKLHRIGETEVAMMDATGAPPAGAPRSFKAEIWGRQQQYLQIKRPKWFKGEYIALARKRALVSNQYSIFFGSNGLLERVPAGIICVRMPLFAIRVPKQYTDILKAIPPASGAAVLFTVGDRSYSAPLGRVQVSGDTQYWLISVPGTSVRLSAVVSERF